MTVVKMMARYHDFGWAMTRLMGADNVRVSSQREFGEKMTQEGYIIGQQLISDYMRNKTVEENGEMVERPRAYPPMEFVAAVITTFNLDAAQREDFITSWLEILPEKRRIAVLRLADTLRGADIPSDAWREMIAFEQDGEPEGGDGDQGEKPTQDSAS